MLGIISWIIQRTTHTGGREGLDRTVQLCGWTLFQIHEAEEWNVNSSLWCFIPVPFSISVLSITPASNAPQPDDHGGRGGWRGRREGSGTDQAELFLSEACEQKQWSHCRHGKEPQNAYMSTFSLLPHSLSPPHPYPWRLINATLCFLDNIWTNRIVVLVLFNFMPFKSKIFVWAYRGHEWV